MALPNSVDAATPAGTDSPALGDDQLRALKTFIEDVFGIPDATSITAAAFAISAGGVVTVSQANTRMTSIELGHASDTTLTRSAAGKLAVEGIDAVLLSGAQTLTDKTLTAPVLGGTVTGTYTLGGTPTLPKITSTNYPATTSAELFGVISDETGGTGVLVGSASPSITTPTFVTSATGPILYGGTAAGSTLNLKGTSNGTPSNAHILLNSAIEGYVSINTTLTDTNLHIGGNGTTVGAVTAQLVVDDSHTMAADVGGSIIFDGYSTGTTIKSDFGAIHGGKENATTANVAGYLAFFTQAAGGTLAEAARFSSTKQLVFSNASTGPVLQFPVADMQILMGGTTDPGWSVPAIQFNAGSSIFSTTSGAGVNLNFNTYYSDDFRYIATAAATRFVSDGNLTFQAAPSGTAGNAITFTTIMQLVGGGGVTIGAPTGGSQGAGTLNVDTNVYLDGNAYANPDYVLEHFFTGKIVQFADRVGAKEYAGLRSLDMVESLSRQYNTLPLVYEARQRNKNAEGNPRLGLGDGGDAVLASVEESFLHLFDHERRLQYLEDRICQIRQ